jgi:hypothetical protein
MAGDAQTIYVVAAGVGALLAAIGLSVGVLARVRARQRVEYAALQAALGLRGELRWSASELQVDWEGALQGVPVTVGFHTEDDARSWWRFAAFAPARRAMTRFVLRGPGAPAAGEATAVHPSGDAAFDARVALLMPMGPRDAPRMGPEARAAVLGALATPGVRELVWDGTEVASTVRGQHLAPATIEALLQALVALVRSA